MAAKTEAGGGINEGNEDKVLTFSPAIRACVSTIYDELIKEHHDAQHIFTEVQKTDGSEYSELPDAQRGGDVNSFLAYLASSQATVLGPDQIEDLSHPLSHYFISSSHNTYLTGNQLSSEASTEGYKNVLLRGCRCVEIDVWDGKDDQSSSDEDAPAKENRGLRSRLKDRIKFGKSKTASQTEEDKNKNAEPKNLEVQQPPDSSKRVEPRVLHGYTLVKEVSFRVVCEAIRDSAFVTSDLPIIVSLEIHTNLEQQEIMVEIINHVWKGYLVPPIDPEASKTTPLPTPKDLRNKILIKVKYTPPDKAENDQAAEEKGLQRTRSSSSSEGNDHSKSTPNKGKSKKKKMLDSLSQLGVYTRSHHFKSWDQPEAKEPSHVFSLSEGAVAEALETHSSSLFKHNKDFLMRTYPKGTRISSSNLTPTIFWRQGIQIVALNWQKWDKGTMLNEAMFAGSGGWVLKPSAYRAADTPKVKHIESTPSASLHPDAAHKQPGSTTASPDDETRQEAHGSKKILDLTIEFIAAQNLPLPPSEDSERSFKPYIKVSLHAETLTSGHPQPSTLRRSISRTRGIGRSGSHKSNKSGHSHSHSHSKSGKDISGSNAETNTSASNAPSSSALVQHTSTSRYSNADFKRERLSFNDVPVDEESLCFVRFKIEDDVQFQRDPMAAWACVRLDRMRDGLRTVRLFDAQGKVCDGLLLVRVTKVIRDVGSGGVELPLR